MRSTTRSPRTQCRHRGAAFAAINIDWASILRSGTARRAVRRWRTGPHGDVFARVVDLDDIIDALSHCEGPDESDRWLAPLVEFAAAGDEIAARTVLQAMLPMAATLYRHRRHGGGGVEEQWNVISVLAEQIGRYPVVEHPTRIAGHLRFMSRRALWRQQRRLRLPECPLDATGAPGDDQDGSVSLLDALAADSDGRSNFDELTATIVDVVSSGDLDADRASLVLAVAAGHRVVELAEHAGCHHSVMSRRITAATSAASIAVNQPNRIDIDSSDRQPIRISTRPLHDVVTTAA